MKNTDSKKLDQIITMLGDIVDVFGKRFDKIDETMARKDDLTAGEKRLKDITRRRVFLYADW